jgi:hypothetical protein
MRRGALLLETMLAMALFVATAGYTLLVMRDSFVSAQRAQRRAVAMDLAGSRLAAIEAGILPMDSQEGASPEVSEDALMQVEVTVSQSSLEGLAFVEVRVLDMSENSSGDLTILARLGSLLPEVSP